MDKQQQQKSDLVAKEENHRKLHEFTWAEKYQPKALKDFICHREIAEKVTAGDVNHVVIEGIPGIGKRTMALALLRETFGVEILKTKEEVLALNLESLPKKGLTPRIQIRVQRSAKHTEVDLSESGKGGYAAEVALLLIKKTHHALTKNPPLQHNLVNPKAIVFYQAEKIDKNGQSKIRSFLENSEGHYKVIFCSSDIFKLQILKPLCRVIYLPLPSNKEIVEVLNFIAKQEYIELPHTLAQNIADKSEHCLQQAIRSFEATWMTDYPFKEGQTIMTGWEDELAIMAKSIIEEQSPNVLFLVGKKIINLMKHHISQDFVLSTLVAELKKHVQDRRTQLDLESLYQETSRGKKDSGEEIISCDDKVLDSRTRFYRFSCLSIEEFVARFMSYYKIRRVQLVSSLTDATHQRQ